MKQTAQQQTEDMRVSLDELRRRLRQGERLVFADARNPQAWAAAHYQLPGAVRVPADEVAQHLHELPHESTIITYCT